MRLALLLCLLATPLSAGVEEALAKRILPGIAAFAEAADRLAGMAQQDCTAPALRPAYQQTFAAWMPVADLRLGPSEAAALSIGFWPDEKGATPRTLARLIAAEDPAGRDPAAYAEVSVAARGLFALERMLFDADFAGYRRDSYACALTATIAADLARQADALRDHWRDHAALLRTPGADGNTAYLTEDEAQRAIYTQILAALEFTADQRLSRPMGTIDRPRPTRAEAWRSGRPLPNVVAVVDAAVRLAEALAGAPLPQVRGAEARVLEAAGAVGDPTFQDIDDPAARFRLEVLRDRIDVLRRAMEAELGGALGIAAGFNALDGD